MSVAADSCPAVCCLGACAGHLPTSVCVVLEAFLAWRGVAWRSSSIAFLFPPCAFLVYHLALRPGFFFFVSEVCSFYFHWASGLSVTGAIVGGWARGARGWVAGW